MANKSDIKPGITSTEDVRTCFNELACSCDNTDVIEVLKKIMFESVSLDIIGRPGMTILEPFCRRPQELAGLAI